MNINVIKLIWIILIIALRVGLSTLKAPLFLRDFSKTVLSKQPETFTELYFTDHLDLPKEIELEVPYFFEFTTHNLEYEDFTYVYEVTMDDGENTVVFDKGQFTLKHGEEKTIPVTFHISQLTERIKVTINLINKKQSVHFWLGQEGG